MKKFFLSLVSLPLFAEETLPDVGFNMSDFLDSVIDTTGYPLRLIIGLSLILCLVWLGVRWFRDEEHQKKAFLFFFPPDDK